MPTAAANVWGVSCTWSSQRGCQRGGAPAPRNRAWMAARTSSACAVISAARDGETPLTRKLLWSDAVGASAQAPPTAMTTKKAVRRRDATMGKWAAMAPNIGRHTACHSECRASATRATEKFVGFSSLLPHARHYWMPIHGAVLPALQAAIACGRIKIPSRGTPTTGDRNCAHRRPPSAGGHGPSTGETSPSLSNQPSCTRASIAWMACRRYTSEADQLARPWPAGLRTCRSPVPPSNSDTFLSRGLSSAMADESTEPRLERASRPTVRPRRHHDWLTPD